MSKASLTLGSLLLCLWAAGCSDVGGFQTLPPYRYRVMVEVDTPEGVRRGSSVIQVETHRGAGWSTAPYTTSRHVDGDAVTVDLGERGKPFMTLRDGDESWGQEVMLRFVRQDVRYVPAQDRSRAEVERVLALRGRRHFERTPIHVGSKTYYRYWGDNIPEFLTFTDLRRPQTARWVAPDHLDRAFGPGVSLREITVETTTDPVTRTITGLLPWVTNERAVSTIPDQPLDAPDKFIPPFETIHFRRTIRS